MAPTNCKYVAPVTITANSNDNIRYATNYGSPSWGTITIDAGTYWMTTPSGTADNLFDEIADKLDTATGDTWVCGLSQTTNLFYLKCDNANGFQIDWGYTAGGFYGIDSSWLGIDNPAATWGTASADTEVYSDHQPKYMWFSAYPAEHDTQPGLITDVTQDISIDGTVYTSKRGERWVRTVRHVYEPYYKAYPRRTYENQDWINFVQTCNDGTTIRYFPDYWENDAWVEYAPNSSDEVLGYWECVLSKDTIANVRPQRHSPGVELYHWTVELLGA